MMLTNKFKFSAIAFGVSFGVSSFVIASPWIDTTDPYLKASITALSNGGIIKSPINTYPLMYKSIAADLKAAHQGKLPPHLAFALRHVEHALIHEQKSNTSGIKLKTATEKDDFQSFGERQNAKGDVNIFNETIGNGWAFKSSVHFLSQTDSRKNRSYEGSYLAGIFDNWVISVDQISQWWGPGNDTTLALSNNAVAFPAVRLTRHTSSAIDLPVLNWLGPVSMTTYFGRLEGRATPANARAWGARVNFKPIDNLELGFTRTSQWGGEGRPNDFKAFANLLLGRDNTGTEVTADEEPGNQLGGFDFRYSTNLFSQDVGIYGEVVGEDESGGLPSHTMYQLGIETSFGDNQGLYHLFAEYTDTFVNCNSDSSTGNCAYEHHIYTNGYRRYGRSMGSTYDSDAQVLTFGLSRAEIGGVSWYGKLKLMTLNKDDANHWTGIHPISVQKQDRLQIEGGYRFPLFNGLLNLQGSVYHSKFEHSDDKTRSSFNASWEYRF